jgi:hypothetical protein
MGMMSTSKSQCNNCRGDKYATRHNINTKYISKIFLKGPHNQMTMSASVDPINLNINTQPFWPIDILPHQKLPYLSPYWFGLPRPSAFHQSIFSKIRLLWPGKTFSPGHNRTWFLIKYTDEKLKGLQDKKPPLIILFACISEWFCTICVLPQVLMDKVEVGVKIEAQWAQ